MVRGDSYIAKIAKNICWTTIVTTIIRWKLSFIILRSVLMCLRGSRSYGHKTTIEDFEIAFDAAKCDG